MLVVVGGIHLQGGADLLEVAHRGRLPRVRARLREDREEDPGQHREDGDHHQQLDEGEAGPTAPLRPVK